jgi:hypothetical protein
VWNYAAGTPLERPAEFAGKAVLSDDEFAQAERRARERSHQDPRDATNAAFDTDFNEFWFQRRPTILTRRTSLITDPPDGKLPPVTPEAQQKREARAAALRERRSADSWEDRPLTERCLKSPGGGPPILPAAIDMLLGQMFLFRILQTSDYVAILSEAMQELRIIPLDGCPHFREPFVSG